MKLYEVPRNTKVRILDEMPKSPPGAVEIKKWDVLDFHHIDGMYSCCYKDGEICHLAAWTEVEIISYTSQ